MKDEEYRYRGMGSSARQGKLVPKIVNRDNLYFACLFIAAIALYTSGLGWSS